MDKNKQGHHEAAVAASIAAADHLKDRPEYGALVAAALGYARSIDEAYARSSAAGGKHLGWVGPHLVHALRALGLSPDAPVAKSTRSTGKLAALRLAAGGSEPEAGQ